MDNIYIASYNRHKDVKTYEYLGTGKIVVNGKDFKDYFKRSNHQMQITRPFDIISQSSDYDVKCRVTGGGLSGQAGAIIHGLSRALVSIDGGLKKTLKKNKLVTRDSRKVERKKYGRKKARRSFQFSKR